MADPTLAERDRSIGADEAARVVRRFCETLPPPEREEAFGAQFDRFADARVVLLGEATHGTSEFYRARAAITGHLIERHGFTIVAVEADWPDAARIDRYVRHGQPEPSREEAFARFPTWMWRNAEVLHFVDWMRRHNERVSPESRAEFRGLDVYSLSASMLAVIDYLDKVDPEAVRSARERYACLTPWHGNPSLYGRAVFQDREKSCEDEVLTQLHALLENRLEYLAQDGETFFDAAQNARIVRAAEQYYRNMYRGYTDAWNLRDRHMFETLQGVLGQRGPESKAVIWAHNSHIGDASATATGWEGQFNIGELCRTAYRSEAVLIGFGTDRGTVAAATDWDGEMEVKTIRPARPDSYERVFRQTGVARSLTDWRGAERDEVRTILSRPRLERFIGVIYRPESELFSHYSEAVLAEQFDAFVWFEETRAITPLAAAKPKGLPETYPFGM